jgi:hypothetical protein
MLPSMIPFIEPLYHFPECRVDVFNGLREIVTKQWLRQALDGTKNGHPLPTGSLLLRD